MNLAMIVGRLGDNPVEVAGGCRLSVATKEFMNKQETTMWHRVVVFGEQATVCQSQLTKGSLVGVYGRLTSRKNEDGSTKTSIIASRIDFLGKPDTSDKT